MLKYRPFGDRLLNIIANRGRKLRQFSCCRRRWLDNKASRGVVKRLHVLHDVISLINV